MEGSVSFAKSNSDEAAKRENSENRPGKGNFQAFRPHPWHGLEAGDSVPVVVNAFVEITPFDLVKYEVDKVSG